MRRALLVGILLVPFLWSAVHAVVPRKISYQGLLKEEGGGIVADGDYQMTFRIYDSASGGSPLWSETQTLAVAGGVFNAVLGSGTDLDLAFDTAYWLGVSVDDGPELTPRTPLVSSPYTLRAALADSAAGAVTSVLAGEGLSGGGSGGVISLGVADAGITEGKIADDAIQFRHVGPNQAAAGQVMKWDGTAWVASEDFGVAGPITAIVTGPGLCCGGDHGEVHLEILPEGVQEPMIAEGAVTGAKLADAAVTGTKLADAAVTGAKLASGAVGSGALASAAVTNEKLASDAVAGANLMGNAVTTDKIGPGQVQNSDLGVGSVSTLSIEDATITTSDIADGAITSAKIADGGVATADLAASAVTAVKIASSAVTTDKISPAAVDSTKLGGSAVTSAKIAAGAVETSDLASSAVTADKIQDGSILLADIGQNGAAQGQVIKWSGSAWIVAADSLGAGGDITGVVAGDGLTGGGGSGEVELDVEYGGSGASLTVARSDHDHDSSYVNEGQADAITGSMIVDGAVTSAEIADGAVTTVKVADGSITSAKIADGQVGTADLASGAVDSTRLASEAVTSGRIRDATILFADIGPNGAANGQVMKWNGSAWVAADDNTGGGGGGGWVDDGTVVRLETASDWVGIGTSTPNAQLHLTGDLRAEGTIRSGSSITIDGTTHQITSDVGTIDFDDEDLVTQGKARIGPLNLNSGSNAFVAGQSNDALGDHSVISGGRNNRAEGAYSVVAGGGGEHPEDGNRAGGESSAVGGGSRNRADGRYAFVGGGGGRMTLQDGNEAQGDFSAILGGSGNRTLGRYAAIGGGGGPIDSANTVEGNHGVIGGGARNRAGQTGPEPDEYYAFATVGGGFENEANCRGSTVGGGIQNVAGWEGAGQPWGETATVAGGSRNRAYGRLSFVGGGGEGDPNGGNWATGEGSVVVGGRRNLAGMRTLPPSDLARYASIGGGSENLATGQFATIPGGELNSALGTYSLAAGHLAKAHHEGTIVLSAVGTSSPDDSVWTGRSEQLVLRAGGGLYITDQGGMAQTIGDHLIDTSTGAYLSMGGTWTDNSDRNHKEGFEEVDRARLLERLNVLPITRWSYKAEGGRSKHIGPVAQDFHETFAVGADGRSIAPLDVGGISLAAIQQLYRTAEERDRRIEELEARVAELESLVRALAEER